MYIYCTRYIVHVLLFCFYKSGEKSSSGELHTNTIFKITINMYICTLTTIWNTNLCIGDNLPVSSNTLDINLVFWFTNTIDIFLPQSQVKVYVHLLPQILHDLVSTNVKYTCTCVNQLFRRSCLLVYFQQHYVLHVDTEIFWNSQKKQVCRMTHPGTVYFFVSCIQYDLV